MFSVSRSLICIVHGVSVVERPKFVATKVYDLVTLETLPLQVYRISRFYPFGEHKALVE